MHWNFGLGRYIAVWIRKKPPDNERLFNILHQMAPVITNRLLADAEILEDGVEYF